MILHLYPLNLIWRLIRDLEVNPVTVYLLQQIQPICFAPRPGPWVNTYRVAVFSLGMNWGVVTAATESDGAERKHERRSS